MSADELPQGSFSMVQIGDRSYRKVPYVTPDLPRAIPACNEEEGHHWADSNAPNGHMGQRCTRCHWRVLF